jgi:formamidopyrimidine-DNA glycosylase
MWRQREDGGYNNNAKDPDYFKKYFQTYGKTPFICDICGKTVSSKSIKARHMKTNYCMKALEEKNKNLLNV